MSGRYRFLSLLLLFWLAVTAPAAHAHASLVFSDPAIGANLSKLPQHVEVEFDGNLITLGNHKENVLQIIDARGREIDAANSQVAGPILGVDVKDQSEQGIFTVRWRVVSSDGHPVQGSYQFTVGSNSESTGSAATMTPSKTVSTAVRRIHKESFWVHHRGHFYLFFAASAFIGIWSVVEYRRRLSK